MTLHEGQGPDLPPTWTINFRHPSSVMEGTENLRVRLGDGLAAAQEEAPGPIRGEHCDHVTWHLASTNHSSPARILVLLLVPAVGAPVGVLGHGGHHQHGGECEGQQHV